MTKIDEAYVFLDTNILLHFQPPDQIDWLGLCCARKVFLVIYPLLLKEISNAKDMNPRKNLRDRAGSRVAWMRERMAQKDQPVRTGVFMLRDPKEPRDLLSELSLDRDVNDDMIIAYAVKYKRDGKAVFVATADYGLEMKLENQKIPVLVLPDALRLETEPDPEKLRADRLERELRAMQNRLPDLEVILPTECAVRRQQGFGDVEDYVERGLKITNERFQQFQIAQSGGRPSHLLETIHSPRQSTNLQEVRQFLEQQHRWVSAVEGATKIIFRVRNGGKRTATDVRLRVYFGQGILLFGPGGFGGKPLPRFPGMLLQFAPVEPPNAGPETDVIMQHFLGLDGAPHIDRSIGIATFAWGKIQQDAEVLSIHCWLIAAREATLGPTALRAEILCEEIGGSRETSLPIEVVLPPARE